MATVAVERDFSLDPNYLKPYDPAVSTSCFLNLFYAIPQEGPWKIPQLLRHTENWDQLLQKWVQYLDQAAEGNKIYQKSATTGEVSGALEDTQAATYFDIFGLSANTFEEKSKKIASVRRAFAALLSKKSQKNLKLDGDDIQTSPDDIQNTITLVKNFNRLKTIFNLIHEEEED